jgi:hypothetical protein
MSEYNMRLEALKLHEKGYKVIPCNDKSSIVKWASIKERAQTEDEVKRYWLQNPNANIAVIIDKDFFVVDADSKEAMELIQDTLPKTPAVNHTGKGAHYFYKVPEGLEIKNSANRETKVDVRGYGGYVIVPPSYHKEKDKHYQWGTNGLIESELLPAIRQEDFKKFYEITNNEAFNSNVTTSRNNIKEAKEYGGSETEIQDLEGLFNRLVPALYKVKHAGDHYLTACCPAHEDKNPSFFMKIKDEKLMLQCSSGCKFDAICKSLGISEADCFREKTIKVPLEPVDISNLIENIKPATMKREREYDKRAFPKHLLYPHGLVGDLTKYIIERSPKSQPVLALAASLTAVGALLGRKVESQSGLRTNLFTITLAKSGTGKEQPRKTIKKIFETCGIEMDYLGGESIASDTGLIQEVKGKPSCLYQLDEFGRMLKVMLGAENSPHIANISTVLMSLYEKADDFFIWKKYADEKREQIKLDQPHICVLGTSVAEHLWGSLNNDHIIDGFLNRFLVFESEDENPKYKKNHYKTPIPENIIEAIKRIHDMPYNAYDEFTGAKSDGGVDISAITQVRPLKIFDSEEASEELDAFYDGVHERINRLNKDNDPLSAMWQRTPAIAVKCALIISASSFEKEISIESMRWGMELAELLTMNACHNAIMSISDNINEKNLKKVYSFIKKTGKKGISRAELTRKSQFLKKRDRDDILENLIEGERIYRSYGEKKDIKKPTEKFFSV